MSATGLLMLDLDHFKEVNDTYGHLAGDAVLREAARVIQVVRSYDLVGRHGGEEFLVVLPGCDSNQVLQSAERVRAIIEATPIIVDRFAIRVTVSVGATSATSGTSQKELLGIADAALYQAKKAGRNRTVLL